MNVKASKRTGSHDWEVCKNTERAGRNVFYELKQLHARGYMLDFLFLF